MTKADGTVIEGYFENGKKIKSGDQKTLNQLNKIINVFNIILPGDQSASDFFEEQKIYNPFIIRSSNGLFSGEAVNWPLTRKLFIECNNEDTYIKWTKPNITVFVQLKIYGGGDVLVIKPSWFNNDGDQLPGTKYFNLIKINTIHKIMNQAGNCETKTVDIYELQEITLQELNSMVPMGGKKYKTNKKGITKNRRKSKKRSRKSKKRRRKINIKNK
jgi:hypothetical protein